MKGNDFMSNNISGYTIVKEQEFDADSLQNFVVSMVFESVELNIADCTKVKVTQYSEEALENEWLFKSSLIGNVLEITSAYKTSVYLDVAPQQKYVIEVPKNYNGSLNITNVSGEIKLNGDSELRSLNLNNAASIIQQGFIKTNALTMKSKSGSIRFDKIETQQYDVSAISHSITASSLSGSGKLATTTGAIKIGSLTGGEHALTNKSGEVKIDNYEGHGSFKSVSAPMQIFIRKLTGDILLNTTNGNISTGFDEAVSANVEASCVSGSIKSDYPTVKASGGTVNTGFATINIGVNKKATGTIGTNPKWKVKIQTTTGTISLVK
jgi:hypothetical protein